MIDEVRNVETIVCGCSIVLCGSLAGDGGDLGWMEFGCGVLSFHTLSTSLIFVAARLGVLSSRSATCSPMCCIIKR